MVEEVEREIEERGPALFSSGIRSPPEPAFRPIVKPTTAGAFDRELGRKVEAEDVAAPG
jgi:hypothetical protein